MATTRLGRAFELLDAAEARHAQRRVEMSAELVRNSADDVPILCAGLRHAAELLKEAMVLIGAKGPVNHGPTEATCKPCSVGRAISEALPSELTPADDTRTIPATEAP